MQADATCARCGSSRIMPDIEILDQGQYSDGQLKARVDTTPDKLFFKGTVAIRLLASVCADCGHTALRVEDPQRLHEAWQKARQG